MNNDVSRPASGPLVEVWDLWFCLNYLYERYQDDGQYVPASEYHEVVQQKCRLSNDTRQNLLTCLRKTQAMGVTNLSGTTNKKYYITDLGIAMLHEYEHRLGIQGD